jgi:hypothetical protein
MRILFPARSRHTSGPAAELRMAPVLSRCRRIGTAGAAALLLAGLTVAAGGPAQATAANWDCGNGLLTSRGHLNADECTGSGATDVYIYVSVLDQPNGPEDGPATVYCASFQYSSSVNEWYGNGCAD